MYPVKHLIVFLKKNVQIGAEYAFGNVLEMYLNSRAITLKQVQFASAAFLFFEEKCLNS